MASTVTQIDVEPDLSTIDEPTYATDSELHSTSQRGFVAVMSTLVVTSIVATVIGGVSLSSLRTEQANDARDSQILNSVRQVVVDLVTLRHQSVDEDIQRVADGTTGAFREQFISASGSFGDVLSTGQVESTGEVKEAGIVTADDNHAVALAAVASTVKNTEAPNGEIRVYRMKVTLDAVNDQWLVSDVEFVA